MCGWKSSRIGYVPDPFPSAYYATYRMAGGQVGAVLRAYVAVVSVVRLGLQPMLFQSSPIVCCSHVCVCGASDVVETHCYVLWIAMDERADLRVK